jgi:hypothetical protein
MMRAFIRRVRKALSHRWMPMADGDGTSMLFPVPESAVNTAHMPKEINR